VIVKQGQLKKNIVCGPWSTTHNKPAYGPNALDIYQFIMKNSKTTLPYLWVDVGVSATPTVGFLSQWFNASWICIETAKVVTGEIDWKRTFTELYEYPQGDEDYMLTTWSKPFTRAFSPVMLTTGQIGYFEPHKYSANIWWDPFGFNPVQDPWDNWYVPRYKIESPEFNQHDKMAIVVVDSVPKRKIMVSGEVINKDAKMESLFWGKLDVLSTYGKREKSTKVAWNIIYTLFIWEDSWLVYPIRIKGYEKDVFADWLLYCKTVFPTRGDCTREIGWSHYRRNGYRQGRLIPAYKTETALPCYFIPSETPFIMKSWSEFTGTPSARSPPIVPLKVITEDGTRVDARFYGRQFLIYHKEYFGLSLADIDAKSPWEAQELGWTSYRTYCNNNPRFSADAIVIAGMLVNSFEMHPVIRDTDNTITELLSDGRRARNDPLYSMTSFTGPAYDILNPPTTWTGEQYRSWHTSALIFEDTIESSRPDISVTSGVFNDEGFYKLYPDIIERTRRIGWGHYAFTGAGEGRSAAIVEFTGSIAPISGVFNPTAYGLAYGITTENAWEHYKTFGYANGLKMYITSDIGSNVIAGQFDGFYYVKQFSDLYHYYGAKSQFTGSWEKVSPFSPSETVSIIYSDFRLASFIGSTALIKISTREIALNADASVRGFIDPAGIPFNDANLDIRYSWLMSSAFNANGNLIITLSSTVPSIIIGGVTTLPDLSVMQDELASKYHYSQFECMCSQPSTDLGFTQINTTTLSICTRQCDAISLYNPLKRVDGACSSLINQGTCSQYTQSDDFGCKCAEGFGGSYCETKILRHPVTGLLCGGDLRGNIWVPPTMPKYIEDTTTPQSQYCQCKAPYLPLPDNLYGSIAASWGICSVPNCEHLMNCTSPNNGKCTLSLQGETTLDWYCECAPGSFRGTKCESPTVPLYRTAGGTDVPCTGRGIPDPDGYGYCICNPGFTDWACETDTRNRVCTFEDGTTGQSYQDSASNGIELVYEI